MRKLLDQNRWKYLFLSLQIYGLHHREAIISTDKAPQFLAQQPMVIDDHDREL
ncbi:MAG: hypothetical protein H8K03_13705 [Nitrospira sp.]